MHWEFALEHDLALAVALGADYYGCCEPLDRKIDMLRRIPNLRKISVSPWCNTAAGDRADRRRLRHEPQAQSGDSRRGRVASRAGPAGPPRVSGSDRRRCHVELIMKDISTVRYQPQRLWEWAAIASEVAEEFAA